MNFEESSNLKLKDRIMKTINYLLILLFLINIIGCKSKKEIAKTTKSTEIKLPFEGKQYETDKNYFRSVQSGISSDLNTAKEIAMMNARSEISYSVKTVSKNVSEIYTKQIDGDHGEDFDRLSRQVSKEILTNIVVAYNKVFQNNKDGKYTYWVVVEVKKDNVITNISNQAKKENIRFDKYQFQKIFNKEMEEFQNSNEAISN